MRVWCVVLLAGCGFQLTLTDATPTTGDGGTVDDDAQVDGAMAQCPTGYISVGNQPSKYRLRADALNVFSHHALCTAEGTHLAVIDSQPEAQALRQFIDATQGLPSAGPYTLVYIGGVQRSNQPNPGAGWISATGTFDGSFWAAGDPQDGGGVEDGEEQFAAIWRDHSLLADVPKNTLLSGICECDGIPITTEYANLLATSQ